MTEALVWFGGKVLSFSLSFSNFSLKLTLSLTLYLKKQKNKKNHTRSLEKVRQGLSQTPNDASKAVCHI
jgi:hypothetical protein